MLRTNKAFIGGHSVVQLASQTHLITKEKLSPSARCHTHLNLFAGWWMGPSRRRACVAVGVLCGAVKYDAMAAVTVGVPAMSDALVELGELANLTVMGSVAPSGMVPFSILMARSASKRWSKRMKPTPLEIPASIASVTSPLRRSKCVCVRHIRHLHTCVTKA